MGANDGKPAGATDGLAVPQPVVSPASSGEPISPATPTLDNAAIEKLVDSRVQAALEQERAGLRKQVETTVQSVKDVNWARLSKTLDQDTLNALVKLAKDSNNDPEIVGEKVALRAMRSPVDVTPEKPAAATPAAPASPEVPGKDAKKEFEAGIIKALEPFKLPKEKNQAVLDEWGKQKYGSELEMLAGLNAIALKASQPPASPSAASIIPPAGGQTPALGEVERAAAVGQLVDSLNGLMKNPSKNALSIAQTKVQLYELGATEFAPTVEESKRIAIASGKLTPWDGTVR